MAAVLNDFDLDLLHGRNLGHFATLRADGSPHVAPVWVDARDDLVLVNTAEGRAKLKNIRRDGRVAISIHDQQNPYRMTSITGTVVRETREGAEQHIDDLSMRYGGSPYPNHGDRVILEIKPERVHRMGE